MNILQSTLPIYMEYVLATLVIAAGIYVLLLIINFIFVMSFRSIMKKHDRALSVLITTKIDNLFSLISFLEKNELNMDKNEEFKAKLTAISKPDAEIELFVKNRNDLTYIYQSIISVVSKNSQLLNDSEYTFLKGNIDEIDRNLQFNVMAYNSDVLGYNYWIRFLPCRYIFLLLRVKEKETI